MTNNRITFPKINKCCHLPVRNVTIQETTPKLYVLINSSRQNFQQRNVIRKTWAQNLNYKFIIGQHYCQIHPNLREQDHDHHYQNFNCNFRPNVSESERQYNYKDPVEDKCSQAIITESSSYQDIILLNMIDTYQNLTNKIKLGFRETHNFLIRKKLQANWIMKIDDDAILLADRLINWLSSKKFNQKKFMYAGLIKHRQIFRNGTWGEVLYHSQFLDAKGREIYPKYASGAAGYVLSYDLFSHLANLSDSLVSYANEDASVGIWLDQLAKSGLDITYRGSSKHFMIDGYPACQLLVDDMTRLVLGHKLTPEQITECWNRVQKRKILNPPV